MAVKKGRFFVLLLVLAMLFTGCSAGPSATVQDAPEPVQIIEKESIEVIELSTSTPMITLQETVTRDLSLQVEDMLVELSTAQMIGGTELMDYLSDFLEEEQVAPWLPSGYLDEETGNLVAVIPGETNRENQAVVITACYESYDGDGSAEYDGSGVAALMHTLSYIQSYLGDSRPIFDIVFAFVNAEVDGNQASLALAEACEERYRNCYQIHYEHVAEVGAGPLLIDTETELHRILPQAVMETLEEMDVACAEIKKDAYLRYDAFLMTGIPSVTIEQVSHFSHNKISDTPDEMLDDSNIDRVAKAVAQFVRDDGYGMFRELQLDRAVSMDVQDADWQEDSKREMEACLAGRYIAYDERIPFAYDGVLCCATGYRPFVSQADMQIYYPEVTVPESVGSYRLSQIDVINANQMAEELFYELRDLDWQEEWNRLGRIEKVELNWEDVVGLQLEYFDAEKDEYLMLECFRNVENPVQQETLVERDVDSAYYRHERRETDLFEGILILNQDWAYRMSVYPKMKGIYEGKIRWVKKRNGVDHDSGFGFMKTQERLDQLAQEIGLNAVIDGLERQLIGNKDGLTVIGEESFVRVSPLERRGEERECAHSLPYGTDIKNGSWLVHVFDNGNMLLEEEIDWECHGHR